MLRYCVRKNVLPFVCIDKNQKAAHEEKDCKKNNPHYTECFVYQGTFLNENKYKRTDCDG